MFAQEAQRCGTYDQRANAGCPCMSSLSRGNKDQPTLHDQSCIVSLCQFSPPPVDPCTCAAHWPRWSCGSLAGPSPEQVHGGERRTVHGGERRTVHGGERRAAWREEEDGAWRGETRNSAQMHAFIRTHMCKHAHTHALTRARTYQVGTTNTSRKQD